MKMEHASTIPGDVIACHLIITASVHTSPNICLVRVVVLLDAVTVKGLVRCFHHNQTPRSE
jgi:hypothetical protein